MKAPGTKAKGGKKNRKFGRNATRSIAMQRYRAEGRQQKNKLRAVKRHLRRHPDDRQAQRWLASA